MVLQDLATSRSYTGMGARSVVLMDPEVPAVPVDTIHVSHHAYSPSASGQGSSWEGARPSCCGTDGCARLPGCVAGCVCVCVRQYDRSYTLHLQDFPPETRLTLQMLKLTVREGGGPTSLRPTPPVNITRWRHQSPPSPPWGRYEPALMLTHHPLLPVCLVVLHATVPGHFARAHHHPHGHHGRERRGRRESTAQA